MLRYLEHMTIAMCQGEIFLIDTKHYSYAHKGHRGVLDSRRDLM